MQVNCAPPTSTSVYDPFDLFSSLEALTVVGSARHTPSALAVDVAYILLQARGGHAASTGGDGAASVLWAGSCHGEGGEGENGGDCELHFANSC